MDTTPALLVASALIASLATAGCAPKFASDGELVIDGAAFRPASCHVLNGATGIELFDASGARLELRLPPARLDAFRDISGAPSLSFQPGSGKPPLSAATCGSLKLTGEGYHGAGKRAASGHVSLSCSSGGLVSGELDFSGCF